MKDEASQGHVSTYNEQLKSTPQSENKDHSEAKVESKEKQPGTNPEASTSGKDSTEINEDAVS